MDDIIDKMVDHILDVFSREDLNSMEKPKEIRRIIKEFTPDLVGAAIGVTIRSVTVVV